MTRIQHGDNLAADRQQLLDDLVNCDEESQRAYLRTQWIESILLQLIQSRVDANLSQRELGERLGKPQSSIARIERGTDIKVSTLFDYLAATGAVPTGTISVTSEVRAPLVISDTPIVQNAEQEHGLVLGEESHRHAHSRAAR